MTFTARDLSLDDLMRLKPKGFYRIETFTDATTITVHLTDEGLTGFIATPTE
ncbi:MAG: hypothetical protein K8F31_09420 [Roseovarius sp.]|nr:hypothetical protein [Roseovarius sp.]